MKKTAVVIAPGRGTYNQSELGYLGQNHADKTKLIAQFDDFRRANGQKTVSELDGAARFSGATHTRGDNASPLIYACAYSDFMSINRDEIEVVAVTGNSMGWYIALACAGALNSSNGLEVVNTMGTLMQDTLVGGQLIYPFVDDEWEIDRERHTLILEKIHQIDARPETVLKISINLGGMIVLAGNETGLSAFEAQMPRLQGRFPMRLPNHAGFHSSMQSLVAAKGREALSRDLFAQPEIPLVDGRGAIWYPPVTNLDALYDYTLGHQVTEMYDYTRAIAVSAREFMPDIFIVLGPGTTLGGATAQSLLLSGWHGLDSKVDFKERQKTSPILISMGDDDQRKQLCLTSALVGPHSVIC